MRLAPGTRLGRYEIVALHGVGGMGEVYRATDSRLGRTVAIKVLARELAENASFRARLEREAFAVAALKHPHICVLYDIAELEGADCLVMEYLDGETLAAKLQRGPLPLADVLRYGIEIAEALAAAHAHGFVHRDLKPGNVMITAAGAKLLDFGLAKPQLRHGSTGAAPTVVAAPLTASFGILGTPGYMAPEQLRGQEADARSDVFALGITLYELLAGERPFGGNTDADVSAAVLARDPDLAVLAARGAPALFTRVVEKCLAKDPERRWQTSRDLADALRWIGPDTQRSLAGAQQKAPPSARRMMTLAALAAVIVAAVGIGAVFALSGPATPDAAQLRLAVVAPPGTTFTERDLSGHPQFALSPDGTRLAFVAERRGEPPRLWVRSLETGAAQPLPGTDNATGPFWSPDGRELGFFARSKLQRVGLEGSPPRQLADAPVDVTTGSWSDDGLILFAGATGGGIGYVSADGGAVAAATTLDDAAGETGHRWPQFLPGGRRFLYFVRSGDTATTGVYVGDLDSGERRYLLSTNANAVYGEPGYLVFERAGVLTTQRFDAQTGELGGTPIALGDRVEGLVGPSLLPVSVARNGVLAYWSGTRREANLEWYDRSGRLVGTVESPVRVDAPVLSPDGSRLLVVRRPIPNSPGELWRVDLATGASSQLTFGPGFGRFGAWSPDGESVVFAALGLGQYASLYRKPANGAGADVPVPLTGRHFAAFVDDWPRDDRLVYSATTPGAWDVFMLNPADGSVQPLVATPAIETQARVSPTDPWFAYVSDESGEWEVYVQPLAGGGKWRISAAGGSQPHWRGDGREIFYVARDGRMMVVPIGTGDSFDPGTAAPLFQTRLPPILTPFRAGYSATADGQRFLLNNLAPDAEPSTITIVSNWRAAQ
jgi:Tol biopolymer transport system component